MTNNDDFRRQLDGILERMKQILDAKGHDYAGKTDRFANFRLCEMAGIPTWKGIVIRLSDKMSRVLSFAGAGECKVKDESVEDTLIDLANYAILCLIAYRETTRGTHGKINAC